MADLQSLEDYVFDDIVSGDDFDGVNFDFDGISETLVGAKAEFVAVLYALGEWHKYILSSADNKLTIDAVEQKISIVPQKIAWFPGTYYYFLEVTFASNRRKTYMKGYWKVVSDKR